MPIAEETLQLSSGDVVSNDRAGAPLSDSSHTNADTVPADAPTRMGDFRELTKMRLNVMVLITTMIGFLAAVSTRPIAAINWIDLIETLMGTGLCAASASMLNQAWEHRHDKRMTRTADRPIPAGRMSATDATILGILVGLAGMGVLTTVNWLATLLAGSTIVLYVLVYTPLKRITTMNTLVGAIPGAIPPVIGYAATGASLDLQALALFAVLFCWQMPHFLAIAIMCKEDYARAGFKMLPVFDPKLNRTGLHMVAWCTLLVIASMVPSLYCGYGRIYTITALILGAGFWLATVRCAFLRTRPAARGAFFASIIYLPLALMALVVDRLF